MYAKENIILIVRLSYLLLDFGSKEVSEACFTFLDLYDDSNLEEFFRKRENDENINRRLCYEKTNVCL